MISLEDISPELFGAAAALGMALARFENELDKCKEETSSSPSAAKVPGA